MKVDPDMRSAVIGSGGKIIRRMVELSGVTAMEMTDQGLEVRRFLRCVACIMACCALSDLRACAGGSVKWLRSH